MRISHLAGLVALLSAGALCCPAFAAQPTKPIQECEREFQARETRLRSEGVSAASFFHECWWHSRGGQPTAVSSDGARERAERVRHDPEADRLWTAGRGVAQASTGASGQAAAASARRTKRREARLQRRINRVIAMRARRLVLAARARRSEDRRLAFAEPHARVRRVESGTERPTLLSRRATERRERYALRRGRPTGAKEAAATAAIADVPADALEGRRSWIGTTSPSGATKMSAVIVGPLRSAAYKGAALHCWDQDVLFLAGRARWGRSLVCDAKVESGSQKIWFEQYDAKL